jgi:hypothetical protein
LLGVLSPALIELIRRERDGPLIRAAIKDDLGELRLTLAFTALSIRSGSGDIDRKFLEWEKSVLCSYNGKEDTSQSLDYLNKLLSESDQNIATVALAWAARRPGGLSLKKFFAPTIEANLPTIWQLGAPLQTELLDISRRLSHLNEEVEQAQFYFRLTFETLTSANRAIASANLKAAYRNVADMAARIADRIDKVGNL